MPFDLHPEYPPEGIPRHDLERRYGPAFTERVRTMIEAAGLVYAPPSVVPNSTRSLELAELARDRSRFDEVHRGLFSAYWSGGRDIGDVETLVDIGAAAGLEPAEIRTALEQRPHHDQIRDATAAAIELGIGAVPAWILDEKLFVSGAQPLELFDQAMERLGHRPVETAEA